MTDMYGWRWVSLGELAVNFDAKRVPVKEMDRRSGPYPYYGASGIVDFVDQFIFDGEFLLIAEDGENLRTRKTPIVFMATGQFWVNNHAHIIQGNGEADTRFLMYALAQADVHAYLTGSTMPKLTQANMNRIPIWTPPLSEQRAIARVLGSLDDKIELNRRMNETLEAMARAIFKSWFVDFAPVRAKAEARQPVGMDAETAALFPDTFEDSPLGEIPKGWDVASLDSVARFLNGLALQKYPPTGPDYLPVIKIAELRRGVTESSDRASPDIDPRYIVEDGDVLFSWSGSLEAQVWCGGRGALNQHLFKVTSDRYPKWFFLHWIKEHLPNFQAIASGKATTMGHIQRHHLTEALVVIPSSEVLAKADAIIDPLLKRTIANNLESHTLAAIRDALLPKLLSGEMRVQDAGRVLEVAI